MDSIHSKLKGINAINVTPFNDQLEIDWESLRDNVEFLLASGMKAIYPCGNTGEFYALTVEEAKQVTRFVTTTINKRCLTIAGVGYDARTACDLAQNAEQAGADGIMVHQPVHPYMLSDGLVAYYKQIAASTDLPMILYIRSEQITHDVLAQVSELPNVVAVKYAINHPPSFRKAIQAVGKDIVWICGTAEMWAPSFYAAGAQGFTSGMVNVDAKRSLAMLDALQSGHYPQAMEIWNEVLAFEELREANKNGNNVSVVKEAMHQLGLIASSAVRPPIARLQQHEKQQVSEILKAWQLKPY